MIFAGPKEPPIYFCGIKATQIHERPFRAAKDHMQPVAALDSFLPNGKKDSDLTPVIIPGHW